MKFQKGNTYGRNKGRNKLSLALLKHDKELVQKTVDLALAGDVKCLLWLLTKKHGRGPVSPIKLSGKETSSDILRILKKNIHILPQEVLQSLLKVSEVSLNVEELGLIEARLDSLESGKKGKGKK